MESKIINELIEDIKNETFKPSKFNEFTVKEGKKVRLIQSLPYYDRIALNAIMRVCGEVLYKTLIRDSYASIKGKGLHDGLKRVVKALEDGENTVYCLKLDIHHFYPSVNQEILISLIKKKIKDKKVIDLLIRIIRSFKEGLPIGYHSSQYFGNFYLSYLDHFIKETLHVKYYFRYCDDIVILDSNKEKLKHIYCEIKEYVTTYLKLTIKRNAQIFPVESRGIDFLGYVIRHDYIRLRKTIKVKALKHLKKVKSEKRLKSIYGTTVLGVTIDIPKDQFLKSAEFIASATEADKSIDASVVIGDPYLKFVFQTTGTDTTTYISVKKLVDIYVAGNGINITSNTVSVKIDASGEAFLTVGTGGLKLSGVQTAINTAVATEKNRAEGIENSLRTDVDSKVSGITTSDTSITVDNTTTTNPKLKVTLSQTDGNRLALNADGLYVTNTIDCGTF